MWPFTKKKTEKEKYFELLDEIHNREVKQRQWHNEWYGKRLEKVYNDANVGLVKYLTALQPQSRNNINTTAIQSAGEQKI